mgnify:CR=1 FL=1
MGKYFGTDGVRGVAGADLTCELAMKIGRGAAAVLTGSTGHRPRILIGKDTRQSGDMLEAALTAGLCSVGADVESLGVLPTPAVAYLVGKYNADAGIVISASHNPMEFNGIKIFAGTGYKLPDEVENQIEAYIDNDCAGIELKTGAEVGRVYRRDDGLQDYVDHLYESIHGDLTGLNVCIDCANGASAAVAQKLFPRLGAKCTFLGIAPDGENINKGVGSTHLENLEKAVVEGGFDCGIAFDGDADRCLGCDEKGQEMDGDKIIALLAQPISLLGAMNTPLSMLITGMLIAAGDLKSIVCSRPIWKLAAVRMLVIPALCLGAFALLGLFRFGMAAQVVLLLECCPAAAITSVFAVQFGHDEQFAAGCVVLTTLLSILTLPLCALVLTMA